MFRMQPCSNFHGKYEIQGLKARKGSEEKARPASLCCGMLQLSWLPRAAEVKEGSFQRKKPWCLSSGQRQCETESIDIPPLFLAALRSADGIFRLLVREACDMALCSVRRFMRRFMHVNRSSKQPA